MKTLVVAGLSGGSRSREVLRRAADFTHRLPDGELLAVHVMNSAALADVGPADLASLRAAVELAGGSFHSVVGADPAGALVDFVRAAGAAFVVIGATPVSFRSLSLRTLFRRPIGRSVLRRARDFDVIEVLASTDLRDPTDQRQRGIGRARRWVGLGTAVVIVAVLTWILTATDGRVSLAGDVSLYLLAVVVVALIGGFPPAAVCGVLAALALNWFFTPPLHTLTVTEPSNIVALVVFLLVALLVSRVVDTSARRSLLAARAGAEAETMSALAGTVLRGSDALSALLDRARETFGMRSAALLEPDSSGWQVLAVSGPNPPEAPAGADHVADLVDGRVLALAGRPLADADRRLLGAFVAQVAVAYRERTLVQAAASVALLEQNERTRTALLNAVSHDLRTPIAAAKASVSSLLAADVTWSPADRTELLTSADDALDRLTDLVTNLLDLSRLQAGALPVLLGAVGLDDVVSRALDHALPSAGDGGARVRVDVPAGLPEVSVDAGLLERVVANLIQNALRYSDPADPVEVVGVVRGQRVELRVIDHGPGIPAESVERIFAPFQRLGDASSDGDGIGLGLAIVRGFTGAMGGSVTAEQTPGGGATMVVALTRADSDSMVESNDRQKP